MHIAALLGYWYKWYTEQLGRQSQGFEAHVLSMTHHRDTMDMDLNAGILDLSFGAITNEALGMPHLFCRPNAQKR